MFIRITILFLILVSLGCASGVVFVDTLPPGSEVYLKSKATEDFEMVGTAPLRITSAEFREKYNVDGPVGIEARASGYQSQNVLITELPRSSDLNVFLTLKSEGASANIEKLNETLDEIFESQRLVKVGRYDEALAKLTLLQQKNPNLSAAFEMEGGVYYLKKDFPRALDSYQKAARLNPNNLELASMKKYLEKFFAKKDQK